MDLSVRRTQIAADDIFKGACRKPKRYVNRLPKFSHIVLQICKAANFSQTSSLHLLSVKPQKIKNITKTVLGETIGRIHMKRQNFDRVGGRKVAALRVKRTITDDPDSGSNKGGKRRKIG